MLPEQHIEISKARLDHAKECLSDAKLLISKDSYRSAANRAYYAIFHAIRSVLALDNFNMNFSNHLAYYINMGYNNFDKSTQK